MPLRSTPADPPPGPLRRLPLPASQPPYDDELDIRPAESRPPVEGGRPVEGRRPMEGRRPVEGRRPAPVQGTLALSIDLDAAPGPQLLRLVAGPADTPADSPTGPSALPDPVRWSVRLAQAAVEGIHGRRSIQQLVRWTDDAVYKALARRAADQVATPAVRPRVRAVRVCRVSETVAEAGVVVQLGPVARAVAMRLEAVDDRWLCTAFDIVERLPERPGGRRQPPPHSSSNASA